LRGHNVGSEKKRLQAKKIHHEDTKDNEEEKT